MNNSNDANKRFPVLPSFKEIVAGLDSWPRSDPSLAFHSVERVELVVTEKNANEVSRMLAKLEEAMRLMGPSHCHSLCQDVYRGLQDLSEKIASNRSAKRRRDQKNPRTKKSAQGSKPKSGLKSRIKSGDSTGNGPVCTQCGSTSTPEWRKSSFSPETLCNACGLFHFKLLRKLGAEEAVRIFLERRKSGGLDRRIPS
ncbi:unnamed protein product [Kuraishia capsulata CBS 1993]|uniref:GATA-type domain-containing protein n=1 Tax=Kuraishia capsulata CBS 1993 TaxID=1382522 RepID=W6MKX4_9ASCO|nr:uncharacterized protein KUCA_T00003033001 [Kuraishia capsulata CBS 1993]CDK27056.1 unnamed protein product [Kuraishia capsulata CBS 1993]